MREGVGQLYKQDEDRAVPTVPTGRHVLWIHFEMPIAASMPTASSKPPTRLNPSEVPLNGTLSLQIEYFTQYRITECATTSGDQSLQARTPYFASYLL